MIVCLSFTFWVKEAQALSVSGFEEITGTRGFGSGLNKYSWSSTTFSVDNNVYVGTFNVNTNLHNIPSYLQSIASSPNPDLAALDAFRRLWSGSPVTSSTGGEIWRFDGDGWEMSFKTDSAEDVGFRDMVEFNGKIYAGTANGPNGPAPGVPYSLATVDYTDSGTALYASSNGDYGSWAEVAGGPSMNPLNSSNRAMTVIGDKLYLGTENIMGPELWSFDGANWAMEGKTDGLAIGEIAEFGGETFIGTWGSGAGFELLKHVSPGVFVDATPQFADPNIVGGNSGVMQLFEFQGQFYLGTVNYSEGFTLLRTADPTDAGTWEVITTDGFASQFAGMGGTTDNAYSWSTQVIDGVLYLGTFNTGATGGVFDDKFGLDIPLDGRGQIWYSTDGINWKILEDNGFDSPFTYGFRTMTTWNDQLVVGTASNMFLPDFLSTPYSAEEFAELISLLTANGLTDLVDALSEYYHFAADSLPYIGTQVYMSTPAGSPIPEPGTLLLLGSGLIGILWYRRKL
jgi:hypothetical protein